MKNTVRYFAIFREQTGLENESLDWPGGTAADLFALMADKHDLLQGEAAALVAINDEMCDWQTALKEGDQVLFFPPVAGG